MNVKEIVKKYVEDNGYDGLAGDNCSCLLDNFMRICNGWEISECEPVWIKDCNKCKYMTDDCTCARNYCVTTDKEKRR